jgi:dTDP-4-dehydrorhamnose reductase
MKIILLGSNGMLGNYLRSYLSDKYELLALIREDIDLSSCESDIISYLDKITNDGDVIINSAGVIKQRDYNVQDMIMVNGVLPHILNKLKSLKKCEVIHITTDCVFSGKDGNYTEKLC